MTRTKSMLLALGAATMGTLAAAQDAPAPVVLPMPTTPSAGAVVLMSDKPESAGANWYKRGSKDDCGWKMADGCFTPDKSDITSKAEFGDLYLHLEFRCPADAEGKPIGHGNAGVGFMGRYEVQIMNSFGVKQGPQDCAGFYNQKAARVNACKPAGQWQSYDIFFRAPRFDADGKVTEKARATVIQNGVVTMMNEDFNGPTGIQYGDFPGEVAKAPIVLQGNHDLVSFRNVWAVPM
ncbi:MAG: DUF1080 domain-containing protein [Armatimonadetes bacterium]|nr:DUF1080 domain-containing protein [Armatimonadota bacterium]